MDGVFFVPFVSQFFPSFLIGSVGSRFGLRGPFVLSPGSRSRCPLLSTREGDRDRGSTGPRSCPETYLGLQ